MANILSPNVTRFHCMVWYALYTPVHKVFPRVVTLETNMEVLGSPLVLGSSTSKYTLSTYKREHNSPVNTEHNAVVNKQPLNRTMVQALANLPSNHSTAYLWYGVQTNCSHF